MAGLGPTQSRRLKKILALVAAMVLLASCRGESESPEDVGGIARTCGRESLAAEPEPRVRIEIKSPAEVRSAVVKLGDIAVLGGPSRELVEKLSRLEIGNAPLPGQERTLSLAIIRVRLRQAGFDPNSMLISSPTTIVVKTKASVAPQDAIAGAVRDYVRAKMPWDERDAEIRVFLAPGEVLVPDGAVSYEVDALPTTRFIGSTSVKVTVLVNGEPCKTFPVRVRIDVARGVLVAARTIQQHEAILPSDLRVEVRDLASVPNDVALEPAQVVGMRASHTIQAGRPVALSAVEPQPVVRKGNPVTIQALLGGVAVTSPGEALEDGCEGARIRVRNKASGAIIKAKVIDADTVRAI